MNKNFKFSFITMFLFNFFKKIYIQKFFFRISGEVKTF